MNPNASSAPLDTAPLDVERCRTAFPGLDRGWTLFDNAGGSQICRGAVERMNEFLYERNVQIGGTYPMSLAAADALREGREAARVMTNAARAEEIVFGPSTTQLMANLASAMRGQLSEGDEIVVTVADHETNIGCWERLEGMGVTVRQWVPDAVTGELDLAELEPLMNARTRLVCAHHVSNILGLINPIAEWAAFVHERGARICIDGVAYAPHRAIDVRAWDVDYYAFSLYKTYGPHHAILYGKHEHLLELDTLYHFFYGRDRVPGKLEPGNASYELAWATCGVVDYLAGLGDSVAADGRDRGDDTGGNADGGPDDRRSRLVDAFERITRHEDALTQRLLDWLDARPDCHVVGRTTNPDSRRVPTIAFRVDGRRSEDVARAMEPHRIAIRFGDFHSRRLVQHLGLAEPDGAVRVSMVHYNTLAEVDRLTAALEAELGKRA